MTDTTASPMLGVIELTAQTLVPSIEQANAIVTKINSVSADPANLVADIRDDESTSDETLKAFQAWREKVQAAIEAKTAEANEYVKANLMPTTENVDVDALKTEYGALKSHIQAGLKFLGDLPGASDSEAVKTLPALKSLRGGTVSGKGTSDTKRPRVNDIQVNGKSVARTVKDKSGNDISKATFTYAAQDIAKDAGTKVEVKDLQSAAFAAAKTTDLSTLNGEPFTFDFHANNGVGEEGAKTYTVKVYPRSAEAEPAKTEPAKTEAATPAAE